MNTPLAWCNFTHRKIRTLSALAGVAMAILLIFLQFGFYRGAFRSVIMVHEQLDYDLALVSRQYVILRQPGAFPRNRLYQAEAVDGVARAVPVYASVALVRLPPDGTQREILVIGIDPSDRAFALASIRALQPRLAVLDSALVDLKTAPGYDSLEAGADVEVNGHRVALVGAYRHGAGFAGNAALVVSDLTFSRIFPRATPERVTLGLIQLSATARARAVRDTLRARLPPDVRVELKADQEHAEQRYFIDVKPVGIMFSSGLLLAFVVGAAILYQVLSAEIANHLREYATLKAMGYSVDGLRLLVWQHAALFSILGFVPAALLATLIYTAIDATTTLPTVMSYQKLGVVLLMALGMCSVSGAFAMRRVGKADPADLF